MPYLWSTQKAYAFAVQTLLQAKYRAVTLSERTEGDCRLRSKGMTNSGRLESTFANIFDKPTTYVTTLIRSKY